MIFTIISLVLVLNLVSSLYYKNKRKECSRNLGDKTTTIAFFHPHCASGGGGERVLWKAIQAIGELCYDGMSIAVVVYTSDDYSSSYRKGEIYDFVSLDQSLKVFCFTNHLLKLDRCSFKSKR